MPWFDGGHDIHHGDASAVALLGSRLVYLQFSTTMDCSLGAVIDHGCEMRTDAAAFVETPRIWLLDRV